MKMLEAGTLESERQRLFDELVAMRSIREAVSGTLTFNNLTFTCTDGPKVPFNTNRW